MEKVPVTTLRKPKWQYPQTQPSPRILQLPRSSRPRKNQKLSKKSSSCSSSSNNNNGKVMTTTTMMKMRHMNKLEVLFDEEMMEFRRRRGIRVDDDVKEEKWKFQAEMLRAECNLLRIEREVAVKRMERRRVQVERILRSSVKSLASGRKKICDGENVIMVLEEEIRNLTEKLRKLQRRSGVEYLEVRSFRNFDKQACLLQRRLVKDEVISDEICVKKIREMAEASLSIKTSYGVDDQSFDLKDNCNMDNLRRKMEGLSKGMLLEMMKEEYRSVFSTTNSSAASSASTSKRIEAPGASSSSPSRHPYKEEMFREEKKCSGHCKAVVRRILEQVRAETEQWSQMQEMLGQVRDEMEELQVSRDFWEDSALNSDSQIQSLNSSVQEWRQKAISAETKANELQAQVTLLRKEIEWLKQEQATITVASRARARTKVSAPVDTADAERETEKRVLVCRLKENYSANDNGSDYREGLRDGRRKANTCSNGFVVKKGLPLRDIGNFSPLVRQSRIAVVHHLHSNVEKNFEKEKVCI